MSNPGGITLDFAAYWTGLSPERKLVCLALIDLQCSTTHSECIFLQEYEKVAHDMVSMAKYSVSLFIYYSIAFTESCGSCVDGG